MAISYKTLWQEADEELTTLRADNERLTLDVAMMKDEIVRLNALLEADPVTRQARALRQSMQIVDLAGIARHMRVERTTPQQWRQRKLLPPVDFPDIAEPLWCVSTLIEKFVRPTRRIWYDNPDEDMVSPAA